MRCVYCQNHQISQGSAGQPLSPERFAEGMCTLQSEGCSVIEPVSVAHQLPAFLEALAIAVARGLIRPVVYNTNGYERTETLDLLDGVIDVYLPDLKYASNEAARRYSDTSDYVDIARAAIITMHGQTGNLVTDLSGTAVRGMILRHLVLPNGISGTGATLRWARDHLPRTSTISLMRQYSPLHRSSSYPELNRPVSDDDYESAVDLAWELGLENCFIQEASSQSHGIPDFSQTVPFDWSV
jgi:putative pyruvate formate lyase activating enzyme